MSREIRVGSWVKVKADVDEQYLDHLETQQHLTTHIKAAIFKVVDTGFDSCVLLRVPRLILPMFSSLQALVEEAFYSHQGGVWLSEKDVEHIDFKPSEEYERSVSDEHYLG